MGEWATGLLYLLTGGLLLVGLTYDLLTRNEQIDEINVTSVAYDCPPAF